MKSLSKALDINWKLLIDCRHLLQDIKYSVKIGLPRIKAVCIIYCVGIEFYDQKYGCVDLDDTENNHCYTELKKNMRDHISFKKDNKLKLKELIR